MLILGIRHYLNKKQTRKDTKVILVGDPQSGRKSLMDKICTLFNSQMISEAQVNRVDIALDTNVDSELQVEPATVVQMKQPIQEVINSPVLEKELPNAMCIICMLNGTFFNPIPTADFIQSLFMNSRFLNNPIPILLVVNKSDCRNCIHNTNAYELIEQEVGRIRNVEDYSFKRYSPCTIYSCNISVKKESYHTLIDFITACIQ